MFPKNFAEINGSNLLFPLYDFYNGSKIIEDQTQIPNPNRVLELLDLYTSQAHPRTGELTVKSKILSNLLKASDRKLGFVLNKEGGHVDLVLIPVGPKNYLAVDVARDDLNRKEPPNSYYLFGEYPVRVGIDEGQVNIHHGYGVLGKMNEVVGCDVTMYSPESLELQTVVDDLEKFTHVRRTVSWINSGSKSVFDATIQHPRNEGAADTIVVNRAVHNNKNIFSGKQETSVYESVSVNRNRESMRVKGTPANNAVKLYVDGRELAYVEIFDGLQLKPGQDPEAKKTISLLLDKPELILPAIAKKLHRAASVSHLVVALNKKVLAPKLPQNS